VLMSGACSATALLQDRLRPWAWSPAMGAFSPVMGVVLFYDFLGPSRTSTGAPKIPSAAR